MEQGRNPIPISLDDQSRFEDMGVRPAGHIVSPHGAELLAVDGHIVDFDSRDTTTAGWFFHCFTAPPARGAINIDHGPDRPVPRLAFFPPGVPVKWSMGAFKATLCGFDTDFLSGLMKFEPGFQLADLDCVLSKGSDRLACLGEHIQREARAPGFGASLFAEAIAMEVALEVIRCDCAHRPDEAPLRGGLSPWQMRRLESFVHEHLSGDLSLQSLSAVAGVSARHLSRVVKRTKGVSVHRWIADLRLAEARHLLAGSDLSMHEISRRSAFRSPAAFSSAFRAAMGLSPSEYRRLAS